ncbi:cyclopropane-fatty-acyl-phospholipid synthase family protein [Alcanivorax sp. DP30]|uniref:SAM-dependent methyltransferase n=1 Tax=Alcanivorax sp. DP30 TaxID=2606217 RepID=UPI001371B5C6|nr:cyclopropane-fatty-acyl-phospholipid synthase family protein [Alcanivorax sp. DP30]MZR62253.1 methyltransferase domain-containing protein [Alcanivorax sp. DP30]
MQSGESASNNTVAVSDQATGLAGVARRLVLKQLEALPHGALRIEEPDGSVINLGSEPEGGVIQLRDWRTYSMMMSGGALGAAEAYMEGGWDSPDLVEVIRYFAANIQAMRALEGGLAKLSKPALKLLHRHNRNSLQGSRRNIAAHYDLGNDFFALFLDRSMMYSSAVYPRPDAGLEEAAEHKLDLVCQRLELQPGMDVLEIGTGWGGLAIHAAKHYGVNVTTTTISREQARYAREAVKAAGLEERITILEKDYRELEGQYDRVVSIEMIEAVGAEFLPSYFTVLGERLKPEGKLLLQAITVPDQRYDYARKQVDFIKRYIFPGGFLPSVSVMTDHFTRHTDLVATELYDIGHDYARTLHHWRERFLAKLSQIRDLGFDERFLRMWDYYLCYCEGAFLERAISTVHIVANGPRWRPGAS